MHKCGLGPRLSGPCEATLQGLWGHVGTRGDTWGRRKVWRLESALPFLACDPGHVI